MSDEPDHIFAYCWTGQTRSGQWHVNSCYSAPEYVRRDTIHQAALDRIAALEAEKATGWAVKVKPLEWVDFKGKGAKAQAWNDANYMIQRWSDGRWEISASYPGYSTFIEGTERFYPNLEAAKAAAEADHIARVTALLEPADQSAIDALVKAATKIEFDWDGEPEDVVELREALAAIRAGGEG